MSTQTVADKAKEQLKSQSTAVQKRESTIFDMIQAQAPGFKMALPKDFDSDRFTRMAITAIKNSTALQRCDPYSVLGGLMLSAQLGLEPNSPLHEASLIAYGGKAQFQIEYRGLLKLVYNSGLVSFIDYDKICENDEFVYEKGFNTTFKHVPNLKTDRGAAYAYYAYAELKDGGKVLVISSKDDILKHARKFSKSFNNGPWQTDFDSMAIKTVLKELSDKKLPKRTTNESIRFAQALGRDENISKIKDDQLGKNINIEDMGIEYSVDEQTGEIQDANVVSESKDLKINEAKPNEIKPTDKEEIQSKENPMYWEKQINEFSGNIQAWNKFKKDNKQYFEQFGGEEAELIKNAIDKKDNEILSK